MSEPIGKIITPIRLEYLVTPGEAPTRSLRGMKEGRLLGERCPNCSKVYMPPRGSCPMCAVPTSEQVELEHTGTVTTFCVVNVQFYGQVQEIPYVCASVLLDGADIPFFGVIQECPAAEVRMGMRVEAVWVDDDAREYSYTNIKYFRPNGEADAPYDSYKEHL